MHLIELCLPSKSLRDVNTPDYPILLVQYGLKNKIRCPAQDAAYIDTQEVHPPKNLL